MKKIVMIASLLSVGFFLSGCYYDEVLEGDGIFPQNVSFSSDVMPIFDLNCNTNGCHDAGPTHAPSLTRENAFNALIQGNFISTTIPTQSILYQEVAEGNMPPSGSLVSKDINIILAWINEGAKNN